ncbi:MAG: hypothetical protein LBF21_02625 [Puniceicoccales bacterium]|nr:hypothetical protein [Puniceicoccales bacterium]
MGTGKLFIISGPSCVGKTTLVTGFFRHHPDYPLRRVVTCTTRPRRPGEVDGQDYHFLSMEDFERKIRQDAFLEFTPVYGTHLYGTLVESVLPFLDTYHLFLTIDVHGMQAIVNSHARFASLAGRCVSIFLKPDDLKTLRRRLLKRRDSAEEIARRLESADTELSYAEHYHHIIPSGTIEENEAALHAIYRQETGASACASAAAGPEGSP